MSLETAALTHRWCWLRAEERRAEIGTVQRELTAFGNSLGSYFQARACPHIRQCGPDIVGR